MLYNYSGVLHIHTKYSDGSADFRRIAKAAHKSGARFIVINDHDTLQGLYQEGEQYLNGILVLVGSEVTPERNHFLCYDINSVPDNKLQPREYVQEVYRQGGFGFLAHPDQKSNPLFPAKMHWENWDLDMPYGIEVWNYFSQWMSSFKTKRGLLKSILFPKLCLAPPQPQTLWRWDQLGKTRIVPAIAGVDAHGGRQFGWIPNILSSYLYQFKTLRTHVVCQNPLRGDLAADRSNILCALKKGCCYLVNHLVGQVEHFSFYLQDAEQCWQMGDEVTHKPGLVLRVKLPVKAHIKIIKDGKIFTQSKAKSLRLPNPQPGVYRVEVYKGRFWPRPWIFSNHIYLREAVK